MFGVIKTLNKLINLFILKIKRWKNTNIRGNSRLNGEIGGKTLNKQEQQQQTLQVDFNW